MKVRCEVDINTETGDYTLRFRNLSAPGKDIEYNEVKEFLKKAFADADKTISHPEEDDKRSFRLEH